MPTRIVLRLSFAAIVGAVLATTGCGGSDEAAIGDNVADAASDTGASGSAGSNLDSSVSGDSTTGNVSADGSTPDVSQDAAVSNDAGIANDGDGGTTAEAGCSSVESACDAGCANLNSDPSNCGACGTTCTNGDVCLLGTCVPNCVTPEVLCNGFLVGDAGGVDDGAAVDASPDDGSADGGADSAASNPPGFYCANPGTDPKNCGGCGKVCSVAHGTAGCANSQCTVAMCNPGWTDCDNDPTNGCEVHSDVDPLHCGLCTTQCAAPNGTAGCAAGQCTVASCNPNFGDCDGMAGNGCELDLSNTVGNCGACGHDCNNGSNCSTAGGATMTCNVGSCQVVGCAASHFDIDKTCTDGCECTSSGTSATCGTPTSLGTLALGLSLSYTGNLVPLGQEAYLTVTFTGNTNIIYHPHIKMLTGASEFEFDILTTCAGALIACGTEGGSSSGRTEWEEVYTAGDPASYPISGSNFIPIPAVGAGGTVIIHVYRRTGLPVTCNGYTLTIGN